MDYWRPIETAPEPAWDYAPPRIVRVRFKWRGVWFECYAEHLRRSCSCMSPPDKGEPHSEHEHIEWVACLPDGTNLHPIEAYETLVPLMWKPLSNEQEAVCNA